MGKYGGGAEVNSETVNQLIKSHADWQGPIETNKPFLLFSGTNIR